MENDLSEGGSGRGVSKKISLFEELKLEFFTMGWRKQFVEKNLPFIRNNQFDGETYRYFVEMYASKWFSKIIFKKSLEDTLYEGGFNRRVCRKLVPIFEPLRNTCYTDEQLIDIIIEYLYGYYEPIAPKNAKYFKNENIVDTWIEDNEIGQIYNISSTKTRFINLGKLYNVIQNIVNQSTSNNHTLFFHSTDWKSCQDISKYGPLYASGRDCLDFGILPSFYLTPSMNSVVEWSLKRRELCEHEIGILIFRVSNNIINSQDTNYNMKYYNEATQEWINLTTNSRRCKTRRNELDNYDFVYGPMVANPVNIVKQNEQAIPHSTIKFQLASKKEKADKYLKDNFIGSIWLNKQF